MKNRFLLALAVMLALVTLGIQTARAQQTPCFYPDYYGLVGGTCTCVPGDTQTPPCPMETNRWAEVTAGIEGLK